MRGNDPKGQEKAPEDRCNGSGGQNKAVDVTDGGNEGMFPRAVKRVRACAACIAWPKWLGSAWLLSKGVRK